MRVLHSLQWCVPGRMRVCVCVFGVDVVVVFVCCCVVSMLLPSGSVDCVQSGCVQYVTGLDVRGP